jgi:hypothetical protein
LAAPGKMQHCHYRRVESHIIKTGREPDESKTLLSHLRLLADSATNRRL